MAEEVTLPQLGESVTEGIITQWLVEVGDTVETDQPIVEISTDKVDTEIPSPVAGTVQELKADVDDTVEVGEVIAIIGDGDGDAGGGAAEDEEEPEDVEATDDAAEEATEAAAEEAEAPEETEEAAEEEADASGEAASADAADDTTGEAAAATPAQPSGDGEVSGDKALTSPLVRKMLREAGLSTSDVEGTGKGGRITREDAERAIAAGGERAPDTEAGAPAPTSAPSPRTQRERPEASPLQVDFDGQRELTQDLTRVRKAIANAMHASLQQTAQLTAAVEVDVTRIMQLRAAVKEDFKAHHGVSLSPLPFFARAACMTIPRHPAINASIDMESGTATFHRYINLGLAVDTDRGLLVPNIKDAQDLNIPGLAKEIADIAEKTRGKGLTPDDIQGGTFTITNTGSRGTLFDTPILNPPEVAILATCAIEKRAVVVQDELGGDSLAVRSMMYLCMTYDHRMIDGADAARFLQDLKWVIETHDFSSEVTV
ncbi:MAG: 2-oxoglutarate dehydrogenase, E2 component, dihydrolipoamide succinyltransferase [Nitriliruptorales bacterium]|nr:2-oxoglutarate dehydrogenase, E2 component, dihydrolipoamide succinyltransferase [Nitriliruptorales bacterium]